MGLFSKLFGNKEDNETRIEMQAPKIELKEQFLEAGFEYKKGAYTYSVEKAEEFFGKIEQLIKEGSPELLDYIYLGEFVTPEDLERYLNDPKSMTIWKKLFSDFKFYYGNYDLPESERKQCDAAFWREGMSKDVSFGISFRCHPWVIADQILKLLDFDTSFVNDSDESVYDFVDRALEVMPYEYHQSVDARIEDGRILLDFEDFLSTYMYTGVEEQTLFEAYADLLKDLMEVEESKTVTIDELWDDNRKIADFYILASQKRYVEAVRYAITNKIYRASTLEYFQTKLDVYNSFNEDTKARIDSLIEAVPDGVLRLALEDDFDAKVECALLGYLPCVFYEDENVFDTNDVLYEGEFTLNTVDKENLIVSEAEVDELGACHPFFALVGEFEERLMDEDFDEE